MEPLPTPNGHGPAEAAVGAVEAHLRMAVPRLGLLLGSLVRRDATATLALVERATAADLPRADHTWFVIEHAGPEGRAEPGALVLPDAMVVRLAEVLMGGPGLEAARPPTRLESSLVANRLTVALAPVVAALEPAGLSGLHLVPDDGEAPPCAPDLLRVSIELVVGGVEGTMELALPAALLGGAGRDRSVPDPHPTVAEVLERVPLTVAVRFEPVELAASEVDGLAVGDVIRLDHPVGRPLVGELDGRPVLRVRPGRRGRRLAVEVEEVLA